MRLIQFLDNAGMRRVAVVDASGATLLDILSVKALAASAIERRETLTVAVERARTDVTLDYPAIEADGRLLPPIDHEEPTRLLITGTGLTHIGSANLRSSMHGEKPDEGLTDAARLFRAGLEGGKPKAGEVGVEPEWFYKGDGRDLLASGQSILAPPHGLSLAEEAELAGVYLIGPCGTPYRLGFVLANDVSDHRLERQNYMYIASSKRRGCPLGPELLIGDLPHEVTGEIRVSRAGEGLWSGVLRSGDRHMTHSIVNLEHHHFKHAASRRPGDVHVHLFGCDATSGGADLDLCDGDLIEIECAPFGRPLRNTVRFDRAAPTTVVPL